MITFFSALLILVIGYLVYGRITEKIFSPSDNPTPAITKADGVDYVALKPWKAFLVQLLNIAGTGPIFGALMGATFGPRVYLWIVFGSILCGGVHDYFTGMISIRHNGITAGEIVGKYLGGVAQAIMRVFTVVLLILVGTVFTTSPAMLLGKLTPDRMNSDFWVIIILLYFIAATLLPIDKLIGEIYPLFGAVLIIMVVGIAGGMIIGGYRLPELSFQSVSSSTKPVWPYMFITVACGAVSGFHATQAPIMSRCLTKEKLGRPVFYGAMLTEGIIALVWAAAGVAFYNTTGGLQAALTSMGQSGTVYDISIGILGPVGGILAIIGVIACPISSGDTAFRSARLVISDWLHLPQKSFKSRLLVTIPLIVASALLSRINFDVIWRYFSWSNQTLAMVMLWTISVYIAKCGKSKLLSLVSALPATFMTAVSVTYILVADEGFRLSQSIGYPVAIAATVVCMGAFLIYVFRLPNLSSYP